MTPDEQFLTLTYSIEEYLVNYSSDDLTVENLTEYTQEEEADGLPPVVTGQRLLNIEEPTGRSLDRRI
jgi:hypothetical protein